MLPVAPILGSLLLLLCSATAFAAPVAADYERSLSLRDDWMLLTRDIVFSAQWVPDSHEFVYRKTVEGGFAFVRENADTGDRTPAFDQAAISAALSEATDQRYSALLLPFETFTLA